MITVRHRVQIFEEALEILTFRWEILVKNLRDVKLILFLAVITDKNN